MIDEFAKEYLHDDLRRMRETMLWKLDGLPEYDIRRPLTATGTNLLGLVHVLTETSRHAGHADILREQLDGTVGTDAQSAAFQEDDAAHRDRRRARIEQAAKAADPSKA